MGGVISESDEQKAVVAWAALMSGQYPELRLLHSIPNGAHLAGNARQRAQHVNRLKAEGLRPGWPDLGLPVARHGYHGLFIEMKWKSNKPAENQEEILNLLAEHGNLAVACWTAEEAIGVLAEYLAPEPKTDKDNG